MTYGFLVKSPRKLFFALALTLAWSGAVPAEEYFDRYGLAAHSAPVDLGGQPLGYPSGLISAVMARDRLLRKELDTLGRPLRAHFFLRGPDMLALLADHKLEAGLLGDMPTLLAAAGGQVWIVGLVKQAATAVVAKGEASVRDLAGKRIGYVEGSSAHHTLLQGMALAGLREDEVKLVPLRVDQMPDALERGEISAFSAWEPAPSIALANAERNRVVFRGQSSDYFVIDREFAKNSPDAAYQLIAGYLRAIDWMRRAQANVERAARWAMADGEKLSGKPPVLPVAKIVQITRREILGIPSAPAISFTPGSTPLKSEFQFLSKLGKLGPSAKWEHVEQAFSYAGLAQVLAEHKAYKLAVFDYDD